MKTNILNLLSSKGVLDCLLSDFVTCSLATTSVVTRSSILTYSPVFNLNFVPFPVHGFSRCPFF